MFYSEVGHAYVVVQSGQNVSDGELARWCAARRGAARRGAARLANYKRPKRIVIADDLPMLPNAKIDRRARAARARAEAL